ncbi:MAG: helix-turn-helix domain-containing protein [Gallionellaceae bacterium]|jgi:DNA-binding XRE family transcriptional regulator
MSNHPNRSRQRNLARNPTPEEIRQAREAAGLTQTAAAAILHTTCRTFQQWEAGDRRMHPAFWELFIAKTGPGAEDMVEAEREACAKTCEDQGAYRDEIEMALECAWAIRLRSNDNIKNKNSEQVDAFLCPLGCTGIENFIPATNKTKKL